MSPAPSPTPTAIDDGLHAIRTAVIERMNADFEDTVLLLGRWLNGGTDAPGARLTGLDRLGLEVSVGRNGDTVTRRAEFAEPVDDPMQVNKALHDLVLKARRQGAGPADGSTSFERTMDAAAAYRTMLAEVVAVTDVNPHLKAITFAGSDLETLDPTGPDAFCYLLLPPAGREELTIGRDFGFEQVPRMAPGDRPRGAYYTVRAWRPECGEVDLLFVLHDHDGNDATASRWARAATPGAPAALWGPRTSWDPPAGTDRYLLVADETGLPATASIIESLPDDTPVTVIAEVANREERQSLPERPGVQVVWAERGGAPAGTMTLLTDAVADLTPPGGNPYVWGGAESHAMTAVRKIVRHGWGLPREAVSLVAYWRHTD